MLTAQVAKLIGTMELDLSRFNAPYAQVEARLRRLTSIPLVIRLTLDTGPLYQQMARVQADMARVSRGIGGGMVGGGLMGRGAVGMGGVMGGMGVGGAGGRGVGGGMGMGGAPFFMSAPGGPMAGRAPRGPVPWRPGMPVPAQPAGVVPPVPGRRGFPIPRLGMGRGMGMGMGGMGFGSQFLGGVGMHAGLPFFSPAMMTGGAVAGAVGGSIYTAVQTESKMADLRRITGRSPEELAGLESELEAIAGRTPGARRGEVFEMAKITAKLGVRDIAGFVEPLAQLAAVESELDVGKLADDTARVMKVFEMDTSQVEGFSSGLLKLANESTATVDTSLNILRRLSGARAAGLGVAESMSLAVGIQEAGLRTESGATAADRVLMTIGTTKGRAKIAKALGLDEKTFQQAFDRSPMEAMQEVFKGIATAPKGSERLEFLSQEMGFGNVRDIQLLGNLGTQAAKFAEWTGTAQQQLETPTALAEGTAIRAETAAASFEMLGVQLENLADAAGKPWLPLFQDLTIGLTKLFGAGEEAAKGAGGSRLRNYMGGAGALYSQLKSDLVGERGDLSDVDVMDFFRLRPQRGGETTADMLPTGGAVTKPPSGPAHGSPAGALVWDSVRGELVLPGSLSPLPGAPAPPTAAESFSANLEDLDTPFKAKLKEDQERAATGMLRQARLGEVFGTMAEQFRMGEAPWMTGKPQVPGGGQGILDAFGSLRAGGRGIVNPIMAALTGEQESAGMPARVGSFDQLLDQQTMDVLTSEGRDEQVAKLEEVVTILDGIGKAVGGLQGQVLSLPALLSGGNA